MDEQKQEHAINQWRELIELAGPLHSWDGQTNQKCGTQRHGDDTVMDTFAMKKAFHTACAGPRYDDVHALVLF